MNKLVLSILFTSLAVFAAYSSEPKRVSVAEAGTLEELLGNELLTIEALVVDGNINSDDFKALNAATYEGKLTDLDISGANVNGSIIPHFAFAPDEYVLDAPTHMQKVNRPAAEKRISKLRTIKIPDNITGFGTRAFSDVESLEQINIPSGLKQVSEMCFYKCANLDIDRLVIPEGVTFIARGAFCGVRKLREVVLPKSMEVLVWGAFEDCSSLAAVNFPEGLREIETDCFSGTALENVELPSTLERIGIGAFCGLGSLNSLTSHATVPPRCEVSEGMSPFGSEDDTLTSPSIPVYVPAGSVDAYKAASGWTYFSNYIGIESAVKAVEDNLSIVLSDSGMTITGVPAGTVVNIATPDGKTICKADAAKGILTVSGLDSGIYFVRAGNYMRSVMLK